MRLSLCFLLIGLLAGCGTPSFLITPVANTNTLREQTVLPGSGFAPDKIVIVEVEGVLANVRGGGFLQPTENKLSLFTQQLQKAADDPRVKAVILRINSPGGTVTTSDTMYQAVRNFREKTGKTVIASAQEMATSGGYYVALAADSIVAHPTSVIGSIGVIFQTFDIEGTMGIIGLRAHAIKSGPLKDMASPFHGLRDDERQVMQGMVDEYYQRFTAILRAHRPIRDEATLQLVTDGRVFTGEQAHVLGLVDQLGTLDQAIELAREKANSPNAKVILYKRPYGYGGSIYAGGNAPQPAVNVLKLELPGHRDWLPTGFYYLWDAW